MEPPARDRSVRDDLPARILEWGVCVAVVAAPLPFGSVVPWARDALELFCVALGAVWVLRGLLEPDGRPRLWPALAIGGLLSLAALQIVPLPAALAGAVQPETVSLRERVAVPTQVAAIEQTLLGVDALPSTAAATLSLDPGSTASALRTGVALAALLLAAWTVAATRTSKKLLIALAISVGFQGLYGLLVVASGHEKIWNVPKQFSLGSATGTWVNPSHYSGYLAATLPVLLAWLFVRVRNRADQRSASGRSAILVLVLLIGLAGLFTSFSRAGILLAMLALAIVAVLFLRQRRTIFGAVALLAFAAAAFVPLVQLDPDRLVDKYARSADQLLEGNRRIVWTDTLRMFADAPWVGTGFGTFESVYPLYRSPEVRLLYRHAHNDSLQHLAEGGLIGALLLIPLAAALFVRMFGALRGRAGLLTGGLAAGLLTTLLHTLVDFPFHLPANAALAAIFAGFVLGTPWPTRD